MISGPLERTFNDLLPYFSAFQLSILSRSIRLILESYKFCQTTTEKCGTILLLMARFPELPQN